MHPEIKEFWEKEGYTFQDPSPIMDSQWASKGFKGKPSYIRQIDLLAHGDKYRFNEVWYSEEEMLRIVRMKAFI
jgi:hypothetical protein